MYVVKRHRTVVLNGQKTELAFLLAMSLCVDLVENPTWDTSCDRFRVRACVHPLQFGADPGILRFL